MKKWVCMLLVLLLTVPFAGISAAAADEPVSGKDDIRRDLIYYAAYGTPEVDGVMDDIYLESDVMYANNGAYAGSASDKTKPMASAEYRMVWNYSTLYIWCVVTDHTKSAPGAVNASATKMDNVDLYINLDNTFDIDGTYTDRASTAHQGMFRYQPNCTVDQEPLRNAWGGLTFWNQDVNESLRYQGGYLNPDDPNDGSYCFEMSIDFYSKGGVFEDTVLENIKSKADTRIGFAIQVNDVIDNDAKRDALIYSNNASGKLLSSDLKNCGVVVLRVQEGAILPDDEETEPPTDKETDPPAPPTTTAKPETDTKKPAVTTAGSTTAPSGKEETGGCKSTVSSVALIALVGAICGCAVSVRRGKNKKEGD